MRAIRHRRRFLTGGTFVLGLLVAASLASAAERWQLKDSHHLGDSRAKALRYEDDKKGRISIVDISVRPSQQTFRNRPRGPRLRVYRVKGTFNAHSSSATIGASTMRNAHSRSSAASRSTPVAPGERSSLGSGSACAGSTSTARSGLSLHGLNVSLPFGQVVFYEQRGLKPGIEWRTPSDQRHAWVWHIADDVEPKSEQLIFIGHWAAPAQGTELKLRCRAWGIKRVAIFSDSHADAGVSVEHAVRG
jgi:hypothetical protein